MKTILTILFWATLLSACSFHGSKSDNANNETAKSVVVAVKDAHQS